MNALQIVSRRNHPTYIREQQYISGLLADLLIRRGRSRRDAEREAQEIVEPHQPASERGGSGMSGAQGAA